MIYSLLIHIYSLLIELASLFHKKARMMRLGQWRTNSILREKIDRHQKYIWFHASSLGEFEQGRPMIEKIKNDYPEYKVLLTFFSPSGYEVRKNYKGADVICYLPFDTPFRVKKFLNLSNPVIAVFIKYEFWKNYICELKRRGIPVYIISAIFRPDQIFFRWYGRRYGKVLTCFTHLYVQDEASKVLLVKHGVRNVSVCGDTRFDRVLDVCHQAHDIPLVERFVTEPDGSRRQTLIAGSSWPPDEELLIPYFNAHPEIKLIIAPHQIHREHLMYIESLLRRPSIRLSEATEQEIYNSDCLIVDSFGQLSSIYRYGSVAYVGGGFGAGIHNVLEAAVYGIPVLFGPKYHKFKEAKDLIAAGGGYSIATAAAFQSRMQVLLADSGHWLTVSGKHAGDFVRSNAGSTGCILGKLPLRSTPEREDS